jgi:hypothetical protein
MIALEDRERWDRALSGIRHGFGHSWESCHAFSLTARLPAYLYCFEEGDIRIVCPLMVRSRDGHPDVMTPFGFSGFAGTGEFTGFREEWHGFAREKGWIAAYIGQNPMLDPFRYWKEEDFQRGQSLFWLDLGLPEDELYRRISRGRRHQIKDWSSEPRWPCTDREAITNFILDNQAAFFRRMGAASSYFQSDETWRDLASHRNVQLLGAMLDGQLVATMLFGWTTALGDALFNVSIPEGRDAAGALMWEGARRLKARGVEWLNMGGGAKAGDAVEESKRRFKPSVTPSLRMKQIFDHDRYAQLCRSAGVDASSRDGFFPPYHRARD